MKDLQNARDEFKKVALLYDQAFTDIEDICHNSSLSATEKKMAIFKIQTKLGLDAEDNSSRISHILTYYVKLSTREI